jgi:hypothetical protein
MLAGFGTFSEVADRFWSLAQGLSDTGKVSTVKILAIDAMGTLEEIEGANPPLALVRCFESPAWFNSHG